MQQRIEIPISKGKTLLTLLGAVALVSASLFLILYADEFSGSFLRNPVVVQAIGWIGVSFFGIAGIFIFRKLFDNKPGLIINEEGIFDNTSALSGKMIPWSNIRGIRTGQVASTKFIYIDLIDPDQFTHQFSGWKRKLIETNVRMVGTPVSISSTALNVRFDELCKLLESRIR